MLQKEFSLLNEITTRDRRIHKRYCKMIQQEAETKECDPKFIIAAMTNGVKENKLAALYTVSLLEQIRSSWIE